MRDDRVKYERALTALFLSFIAMSVPVALHAQSNPDIVTLRGLHVIALGIEKMPDLVPFVDTASIRVRVELKLREAGIRVVDSPTDTSAQGFVYLRVGSVHPLGSPTWALDTRVAFEQGVRLLRSPSVVSVAPTWEGAGVTALAGTNVLQDQVTTIVDEAISEFLNAWLEANPR